MNDHTDPVSNHRPASHETRADDPTLGTPGRRSASRRPPRDGSAETTDTMVLHTREAYRMFTGRRARPDSPEPAVVGGQRFATLTKVLWNLSAQDNPYADWTLIRLEAAMQNLRTEMQTATADAERVIGELERKGLTIAVLGARSPTQVPLAFRSPYGYAMAELVAEFDYYVRIVKTLVYRDQWSDDDGRTAIRAIGRPLRAVFVTPVPWVRALLDSELLPLTRRDFAFEASPKATARVDLAHQRLGELPDAVLAGTQLPRHTRRRTIGEAAGRPPGSGGTRREEGAGLL